MYYRQQFARQFGHLHRLALLCVRVRVRGCVDSSRQQDNRVTLFHRCFAVPSKEIISLNCLHLKRFVTVLSSLWCCVLSFRYAARLVWNSHSHQQTYYQPRIDDEVRERCCWYRSMSLVRSGKMVQLDVEDK